MGHKILKGIATDSIILITVRCITVLVSIIQTMILTRVLSSTAYGTYSEGLLIISFSSPFLSLGLQDSVNYFYNKSDGLNKNKSIDTVFSLSITIGIVGALLMLIFQSGIITYFKNQNLSSLFLYVVFRPCLQNLIALYQPLYISTGQSRIVALRSFIVSLVQVTTVGVVSYCLNDVVVIFALLFILDVLQVLILDFYLRKHGTSIHYFCIDKKLVRPILNFALPMLLATSIGTINLNLDKLMISRLMGVDTYALYANVSKELPFAFIAQSITAVITPLIVRLLNNNRLDSFRCVWSDYLQFGYTVSWPLIIGAFFFAPSFICFLYSSKYLSVDGINVFRVYLIATMLRFTYFGIVPTALGKTRIILKYSMLGMILNIALNYTLYYFLGIIGPSIATVISMVVPAIFYFRNSLRVTNSNFYRIIKIKELFKLVSICVISGGICLIMFNITKQVVQINDVFGGFFFYFIYCLIVFLFNYRNIRDLLRRLNNNYA